MINLSYIIPDMFNERKDMNKKIDDAIFYIRYFAGKHGELIERKGQLDDKAKGEYTCKKGYQCFNYLDVW